MVNGKPARWKCIARLGEPAIEILTPQADGAQVQVRWQGDPPVAAKYPAVVGSGETFTAEFAPGRLVEVKDPQTALKDISKQANSFKATAAGLAGHRTAFARVEQGELSWWVPIVLEIRPPFEIVTPAVDWKAGTIEFAVRNNTSGKLAGSAQVASGAVRTAVPLKVEPRSLSAAVHVPAKGLVPGTNPIVVDPGGGRTASGVVVDWHCPAGRLVKSFECVDLSKSFNDRVTRIFQNEYRSPRSPYCSLQIPLHGFGDWCYGGRTKAPLIDDSALRAAAGKQGRFVSPQGVPFATPGPGDRPNVLFTSQWDNYPEKAVVPLSGQARHIYFLVAGSTHPMQSQLDNGEIVVSYADGQTERLPLHNPSTWWPIERDYQLEIDGFCIPRPYPPRIDLGSGRAGPRCLTCL